jgi:hypothetical protein
MITSNPLSLLKTGSLGPLTLGMSKDAVSALAGPPDDFTTPETQPEIWKYGCCEIMFEKSVVFSIEIKLDEIDTAESTAIIVQDLSHLRGLAAHAFRKLVDVESLTLHREIQPSYAPEERWFLLAHSARAVFINDQLLAVSVLRERSAQ